MMMIPLLPAAEEEEVAEAAEAAVVELAVVLRDKLVAEDRMPSRPSRRPRKISPHYEVTEP